MAIAILLAQVGGESLDHAGWLIGLALLFGFFMAWSIGANDVANAMGTSVGSKSLTLKQAIVIAAIVEFAGAILVGRHVSDKIRSKIFDEGDTAKGRIELVFEEDSAIALPASVTFRALGEVDFRPLQGISGVPLSEKHRQRGQLPFIPTKDGRHALTVEIEAVERGAIANLVRDTLLEVPDSIPNLVRVVAVDDFKGGRDGAFDSILHLYSYGMLAALLAAATWLMISTYFGLPVSTTHSIVGAVVGFGMVAVSWDRIAWGEVTQIIASWIVSPVLAGVASYFLFTLIHRQILVQRDVVANAKRFAPILMFSVFLTVFLITLYKGLKPVLKPLGLEDLEFLEALWYASLLSLLATIACVPLVRRVRVASSWLTHEGHNPALSDEVGRIKSRCGKLLVAADPHTHKDLSVIHRHLEALENRLNESKERSGGLGTPEMRATERIFVYLQIVSACALAFAHGANDVANSVGPLAGVIFVAKDGVAGLKVSMNNAGYWGVFILVVGGIGIVVGLGTWGWRVIETVGRKITELTPTRGFAAQFGAAATILIASRQGLPVSTTHTLVGAVLGVGFARGVGALNFRVLRDIAVSWVVTLPAGAVLTIVFYFIVKWIFGG